MQFIAATLALAATVVASPRLDARGTQECTPGTIACTYNYNTGAENWSACNYQARYEVSGRFF
jgi:hypothetical protein